MVEWSRTTPWRQGSVVDKKELDALMAKASVMFPAAKIGVIISHHCDIAARDGLEPTIEVIPASFVPDGDEDGSLTHAKNARTLHLAVNDLSGESRFIKLVAGEKFRVDKGAFMRRVPSAEYQISNDNLDILQRWLAARYRRHAFSDSFETCFDQVEKKFRDALKKSSKHIRAVLFDVDETPYTHPSDGPAPFGLDIYLVYATDSGNEESLHVAESTKTKIEKVFREKYLDNGKWKGIELHSCEVISDFSLRYIQYLKLAEWRAEDMSLKSDPPGPMTK